MHYESSALGLFVDSNPMSLPNYRPAVLGVFINDRGRLLVLERIDTPQAWQFPQGGIEPEESPLQALEREMNEELGNATLICRRQASYPIRYEFPPSLAHTAIAQNYRGQSVWWFLCQFGSGGPDLSRATHKEFQAFKWVEPAVVVAGTVAWKQAAYAEGLRLLDLIPPAASSPPADD